MKVTKMDDALLGHYYKVVRPAYADGWLFVGTALVVTFFNAPIIYLKYGALVDTKAWLEFCGSLVGFASAFLLYLVVMDSHTPEKIRAKMLEDPAGDEQSRGWAMLAGGCMTVLMLGYATHIVSLYFAVVTVLPAAIFLAFLLHKRLRA